MLDMSSEPRGMLRLGNTRKILICERCALVVLAKGCDSRTHNRVWTLSLSLRFLVDSVQCSRDIFLERSGRTF